MQGKRQSERRLQATRGWRTLILVGGIQLLSTLAGAQEPPQIWSKRGAGAAEIQIVESSDGGLVPRHDSTARGLSSLMPVPVEARLSPTQLAEFADALARLECSPEIKSRLMFWMLQHVQANAEASAKGTASPSALSHARSPELFEERMVALSERWAEIQEHPERHERTNHLGTAPDDELRRLRTRIEVLERQWQERWLFERELAERVDAPVASVFWLPHYQVDATPEAEWQRNPKCELEPLAAADVDWERRFAELESSIESLRRRWRESSTGRGTRYARQPAATDRPVPLLPR